MPRRKPKKDPPRPESVEAAHYEPHQPQYWMLGGAFIEPEAIPPQSHEDIGSGSKPKARERYLREYLPIWEEDLTKAIARYRESRSLGMRAVSPFIAEAWRHRVHTGEVKSDTVDPVSEGLARDYQSIRYARGRVEAARQALLLLEQARNPLFSGLDD